MISEESSLSKRQFLATPIETESLFDTTNYKTFPFLRLFLMAVDLPDLQTHYQVVQPLLKVEMIESKS